MSRKNENKKGANGAGSIRKITTTRNGKEYTYWQGRYTEGYDACTGKQIQRSITGKTQKEVAQLLKARGSRALLHCDAVQGFLKIPCDPVRWGVDLMSLSAHKIGGPKGIGALYVAPRLKNLRPLLPGGGQERGLRSGTEATAQIAGFAKAVELYCDGLDEKRRHLAAVRDYCRKRLLSIPTVAEIGRGDAPHILSVSLPGYPSANIVADLGAQGICISAGSACHKGKASHVVSALGLDKKTAAGVIRVSFGPETTFEEIDALHDALLAHKNSRFPML